MKKITTAAITIALSFNLQFLTFNSFAQDLPAPKSDIIYKPDGSKIEAKVLEISPTEVKYKLFSNPDGPLYSISKNDLMMIIYQNGKNEVFANSQTTNSSAQKKTDSLHYKFGRNFISYNLFSIMVGNISVSYEHFLPKGYLSFKIPFIVGFGDERNNGLRNGNRNNGYYKNIFTSGIDINFYPTGQGKIRFFTGPSLQVGVVDSYSYYFDDYYYYNYYSQNSYYPRKQQSMFYAGMVNNGILFQPLKNFNMSLNLGLGVRYIETSGRDNSDAYATFGYHLGYRF